MTMTDTNSAALDPALLEALRRFAAGAAAPAIPEQITAQARELDDLRVAIKTLKDRETVLRTSLLDFLATENVDSVTDGEVSISRSSYNRENIDRKRMEALYPKVLADVTTKTPVTQVRVKIKG